MKENSIEGLGKVILSINLQDLYCGMAMQGILANPTLTGTPDSSIVVKATKIGKQLYEYRQHEKLCEKKDLTETGFFEKAKAEVE